MQLPSPNTVAFVIALVAFFATQFQLKGYRALACAFVVALLFNIAPILAAYLPASAPFTDAFLKTILLTIAAAGSYDFITNTVKKINAPSG